MKTNLFSIFLVFGIFVAVSCKKNDEAQPDTNSSQTVSPVPLSLSLSAEKTTIAVGNDTKITASVSGGNGSVNYNWSVNTNSTLTGSGTQVTLYASCPSCTGPNKVTCRVTDANNNSATQDITITVQ